jgi:glycosyltransferase involved in cell wall biosynthesis
MNPPAISVVMSVYNGQVFLSEAIESILRQTLRDFEFVIIDDGSTDGTAEILSAYANRDERVRVFRHKNKGRAESLNIGMSFARGQYIARMDADDIALRDRLQEQYEFMQCHPEVGLLSGAYERIGRDGQLLDIVRPPLRDDQIRLTMLRTSAMCHPAVMMRKEIALLSGGYRASLLDADDYDLWLRMSEHTQMANLENTILRYRVHPKQASVANSVTQTLCVIAARTAAICRKLGEPDPLSGVEKVTPQLLRKLGVTTAEIQDSLLANYGNWMELLDTKDPDAALGIVEGILQMADSEWTNRSALADAWLKAAAIYYRDGRLGKALLYACRGILIRPIVVGRPAKRIFTKLVVEVNKATRKS